MSGYGDQDGYGYLRRYAALGNQNQFAPAEIARFQRLQGAPLFPANLAEQPALKAELKAEWDAWKPGRDVSWESA